MANVAYDSKNEKPVLGLYTGGLILMLLLLAFGFQGSRGIWMPDEGYYVGIAKEMLDTGDFLVPRLNSVTWLDKPPLSLWGSAAGMKLLGQNEWGARAFHGLCFLLTGLLIAAFGRSMWGKREGTLAAIIYATMLVPFAATNVVTPDTPLALMTTITLFCFWKSIKPGGRRQVLWKMLMCAAFGLGFLTKGPAALIPSAAAFVVLLIQRRTIRYFLTPWAVLGFLLFCIIGLGWYVYIACEIPGALDYIWDNQVLGRTVSSKYARNPGLKGAFIYAPVIILGALPWSFFWCRPLWRNKKNILNFSWKTHLRDNPINLFLSVWIGLLLLIFCAASSKLPLYVLPIFPALALVTARLASSGIIAWKPPRGVGKSLFSFRLAIAIWVIALLGLRLAAAYYPSEKDIRALYMSIREYLPDAPYEIVAVEEHLEGLTFYGIDHVERVTTSKTPYPFFVTPDNFNLEIEGMPSSNYMHLFICRKEKRARIVRDSLSAANVKFNEIELPQRRHLFICDAIGPAAGAVQSAEGIAESVSGFDESSGLVVRLVALGDMGKGKGKSRQYSVAAALHLLFAEKSFDDGVILLGDNLYCGSEDAGDLVSIAIREFEEPFADLLKDGVPFYATLGNHDDNYGLESFELEYVPFHMQGRRYYSKTFGDELVEVFFLDSNTLRDGDPDQIAWLDDALARSKATWKVVALHHPLYSTNTKYPSNPDLISQLEDILLKHKVQIVLQGHNHVYERLIPIKGIHYITAGSGGTVNENTLPENSPQRIAGNDRVEIFLLLEFKSGVCEITAYDSERHVIDNGLLSHETHYLPEEDFFPE